MNLDGSKGGEPELKWALLIRLRAQRKKKKVGLRAIENAQLNFLYFIQTILRNGESNLEFRMHK